MTNVVRFSGITTQDHEPWQILDAARERALQYVVVLGCESDGRLYFAASRSDGGEALWLMERARHKLMAIADELEGGSDAR